MPTLIQILLLVLTGATNAFIQNSCNFTYTPGNNTCRATGHLTKYTNKFWRKLENYTYNECVAEFYNDETESWSWDESTHTCTTYQDELSSYGFTADNSSSTIYSNFQCYTIEGYCGVLNPSFENISQGSRSNGTLNVMFAPWVAQPYTSAGETITQSPGYIELLSNSGSDIGKKAPTPFGEHFIHIHQLNNHEWYLQQYPHPISGHHYTLTWSYNFYKYKGASSLSQPYNIQIFSASGTLDSIDLDPTKGDANATWVTRTVDFKLNQTHGYLFFALDLTPPYGDSQDMTVYSDFLFDNINITPKTTT